MLSGDHVMGWNSTLVAVPDGSMADYLDSLRRLIALPYRGTCRAWRADRADGPDFARRLLAASRARNEQVVRAVNEGARRIGRPGAVIYPGLPLAVTPAARMVLKAHAEYLEAQGRIRGPTGAGDLRARCCRPSPSCLAPLRRRRGAIGASRIRAG
jgi:glyoxylase-like metal-dependent hydrolase (beta-lactamase superfamily II)